MGGEREGQARSAHQIVYLQWVEKADPLADAKKAVDRREFTLLGINGYTWTIPGIDESKKFELRKKYGLRIIEGTSDAIQGEEHSRLTSWPSGTRDGLAVVESTISASL